MGMTTIQTTVFNPADITRSEQLEFTVDSGAGYSVVPRPRLDAALMGATTLEGFGFVLDPFRRELRPMSMRM